MVKSLTEFAKPCQINVRCPKCMLGMETVVSNMNVPDKEKMDTISS